MRNKIVRELSIIILLGLIIGATLGFIFSFTILEKIHEEKTNIKGMTGFDMYVD